MDGTTSAAAVVATSYYTKEAKNGKSTGGNVRYYDTLT